jgi:pyruvate dehydrogenase E2 component (dihydrolipoamide acetyltransferase)
MATEVVMPRLSDTMDAGTIARWLKHEGDEIKRGDIIAEIETDKANMELEAFSGGVLAQIYVQEGQSANLGQPIAVIAATQEEAEKLRGSARQPAQQVEPADRIEESHASGRAEDPQPAPARREETTPNGQGPGEQPPPAQTPPAAAQQSTAASTPDPMGRVKASPLARRMAEEHGIDLQRVSGTGPGGRITKDDIQKHLVGRPLPSGTPEAPVPAGRVEPEGAPQPAAARAEAPAGDVRGSQPVDMSRMQTTIARRLTEARFTAPDFLLTAELDMTEARALLTGIAGVEGAPRVGPNDLLIKAAALALVQHREANAGWENDRIVRYNRINIGNAVATPGGGLIVPVIRDADTKTLGQIAAESKALIEKARNSKLAPAEREGGTFTVSNLGMFGIDQFTSILNPPEACSLAVGAIVAKPVVIDGEVAVRERMRVTLTCDHRVINGAEGADFLRTLRRFIEHPMLMVL